jgi:hypothetical protein
MYATNPIVDEIRRIESAHHRWAGEREAVLAGLTVLEQELRIRFNEVLEASDQLTKRPLIEISHVESEGYTSIVQLRVASHQTQFRVSDKGLFSIVVRKQSDLRRKNDLTGAVEEVWVNAEWGGRPFSGLSRYGASIGELVHLIAPRHGNAGQELIELPQFLGVILEQVRSDAESDVEAAGRALGKV